MLRNVLVGVDGSASGKVALRQAIDIVRSSSGRIGLVSVASRPSYCVTTPPFALPVSWTHLAAEMEAEAKQHLDEAERAVPADVPVTKLLLRGRVAEALVTNALDGPWDLIVVGHAMATDRSPLGRRVGPRLMRSSPVPVLIVRAEPEATTAPEGAEDRSQEPALPKPVHPRSTAALGG